MPVEPLDPPDPRPSYSTCMLLHRRPVANILAVESCEVVITTENVGPAVEAAGDLLRAFDIEPDMR